MRMMTLKRIASILMILVLPMQTVSSNLIASTAKGNNLIAPENSFTITAIVDGGHGTAIAASDLVEAGQSAVITITPDVGYHIETVTDNDTDVLALVSAGVYTISDVQAEHEVKVTFAINQYALNVTVETAGTGKVNDEESLAQTLDHGTVVTLTAQPAKGYFFDHWLINSTDQVTDNPLILTMDAPKTIVAVFTADPNVVSAKAIVAFFEENTVLGTLTGIGKTAQAQQGKLKAFDNKLKAVVHALEAGETADVVGLLTSTAAKVDGELNPPDFIAGDQSDELLAMIQALIASLPPNENPE